MWRLVTWSLWLLQVDSIEISVAPDGSRQAKGIVLGKGNGDPLFQGSLSFDVSCTVFFTT